VDGRAAAVALTRSRTDSAATPHAGLLAQSDSVDLTESSPHDARAESHVYLRPVLQALNPLFDPVVATMTRERTFKRRVLDRARLCGAEDVLDLACGTGTLAISAARATPGARVAGVDADQVVLAKARTRARCAGVDIAFDEALSTKLPYEDRSFDVVLSTLFFHHLHDEAKASSAAEIVRILRPRGRLVIGDVGRPQDPAMRLAVLATVQLLDGVATTALNVAGRLVVFHSSPRPPPARSARAISSSARGPSNQ
jgi:ubiquinone/menaquinone biosynthesis C-methylase UbiE